MVLAIRKVSKNKQVRIINIIKGLKNKVTLMGKIKRFERRKPKIARLVKFYLIFFFLGAITLSLTPGSQLPFQKRLKLGIFHSKSWFNYYWNYEIGKQKEKYLYLELQDLLMQMSGHQIYDVDEICRVFGEVQEVINEDLQIVKLNFEKELTRLSQEIYLTSNKDKQKLNSSLKNFSQNKQKSQKNLTQLTETSKSTTVIKRNQLKQKIKAQLDSKYQQKKIENKKEQKQTVIKSNLQRNSSIDKKPNETTSQQSSKNNSQSKQYKNLLKSNNDTKQIDLRNIFWNSLTFSPSFNSNILMYYVLVLQNVIRSEIELIKNPKFYQTYQKAVQNFIFNQKVQTFLQENCIKKKQSLKDLNEKLERQIHFLRVLRKSSMTGNKKSSEVLDSNAQEIDPHKLLTYIINYRHLMNIHEKEKMQKNMDQNSNESQIISQKIKDLMINYKNMIDFETGQENKKQGQQNKIIQRVEDSTKLMEMAIKNKPFINSLKQLYIQSKQSENNSSPKDEKNKYNLTKNKNNNSQQEKNKQTKFLELKNQPTYQIIGSIFQMFDKWYSIQNNLKKDKK